jgi:hypothetical protein
VISSFSKSAPLFLGEQQILWHFCHAYNIEWICRYPPALSRPIIRVAISSARKLFQMQCVYDTRNWFVLLQMVQDPNIDTNLIFKYLFRFSESFWYNRN